MELFQKDLQHIGHTKFGDDDGNLSILTSCHSGIEMIMLREILRLYGAQVIEVVEGTDSSDSDHRYVTDLSWEDYCKVFEDND
jgi:hypothetical protein